MRAQWAPARLSRTENGKRQVTTEEAATLLTVYGLPVSEREEILAQMQAGASSGWWDRRLPGVPPEVGALASYEADAIELIDVNVNVVPGLLHTYETGVAVLAAADMPPDDIETQWMARLRRQQILGKLDYAAFVGEMALRSPFGGRSAHRAQIKHLLAVRERGIVVRVVPALQTRVLVLHSFLWMRFANTAPVVHVEMNSGAQFLHEQDADAYTSALQRLDRIALSDNESRKLMAALSEGV